MHEFFMFSSLIYKDKWFFIKKYQQGNKIGKAHLKWDFSEAAVLYLRGNDMARNYINKLQEQLHVSMDCWSLI